MRWLIFELQSRLVMYVFCALAPRFWVTIASFLHGPSLLRQRFMETDAHAVPAIDRGDRQVPVGHRALVEERTHTGLGAVDGWTVIHPGQRLGPGQHGALPGLEQAAV